MTLSSTSQALVLPRGPIGRGYVCRAVIGTGGMGEVYLATDPATGADVALKLIRADRAQRARALRRFTREVRAMAKLEHTSIVSVYDYGVHVDEKGVRRPFFVMEYLEGGTLRDFIKRGPTLEDTLPIFDQMLAALAYAHARGVIHRDLKPENVILVDRGGFYTPKILDFGIARMLDDDIVDEATIARLELELADVRDGATRTVIDELVTVEITDELDGPSNSFDRLQRPRDLQTSLDSLAVDPEQFTDEFAEPSLSARLTQMNQCVGTPAYLAPEQIRPRKYAVGPTSDLYAIGIMLYEVIAGHRPYRARTPKELLKMHLVAPIPELNPRPALTAPPESLLNLVRKLMSKHPHMRPPFAADVRRALRAIMRGREIEAPLVPAFDRWASEGTLLLPDPGLAEPGSSQLGDRSSKPKAPPASLSLGLLSFREPPLVGRTTEQHAIWQHFVETHDNGTMQVVLVDGESGIGKTRIVRWLVERAEEMGLARSLVAPYATGPSGGGLRVAVERFLMCKGMEGDILKKRVAEALRRLELHDPWLVTAFLRFLNPPESSGGTALQVSSSMAYTLIETLLERFASDRPVIFLLDDVHWAPDEAFELMHFLLENQRSRPFPALVVATLRSEDLLTNPSLTSQVTTLTQHSRVHRMTLEPLAAEDIARLTSALVPLPAATVATIAERAAGQPMFAVQLLEHWASNGELEPADDGRTVVRTQNQPVPTRINDVVDRRIVAFLRSFDERPSPNAQRAQSILEWMAIIGEPIEFALLHELARSEGATSEDVDLVWEASLIDGICVEDALDATLSFDHQIIGGQLLDWARAHARYQERQEACADAKMRSVGRDPIQLHLEVSRHLREAGARTRAWRHLVYSARCSLDRNQDRTAHQRLKRALEALATQASGGSSTNPPVVVSRDERFQARYAYVEAGLRLNLYDEADHQLGLLRKDAANLMLHEGLVALVEADLLYRRGKVEAAAEHYRGALPYFAGHDDYRAKALSGLGTTLARCGHLRAGLEALEEAEPLARASGDENLLANVLLSRGSIHVDAGSHNLFARYFEEALALFTSNHNLIGVGDAHVNQGRADLLLGNLDEAQAHFEEARSTRTVIGDRRGVINVLNALGEVARARRDLTRAARVYTRALDLLETCGADEDDAVIRTNLGIVEFELGRYDEARATLTAAATAFQSLGKRPFETVVAGLLACTEAKVGDFEVCRYWVSRIQRMDLDRAPADRDYAYAVREAAHLCLDAGHEELAVPLLFQASDAFRLLGEEEAQAQTDSLLVTLGSPQ